MNTGRPVRRLRNTTITARRRRRTARPRTSYEAIVESRIELDGIGTRMLEVPGEGPPIVLLHGFSDSADTWRSVMLALATMSRRVVAVDLPSFGAAERLPRGPVLSRLDGFTVALVRRVGADGPVVLGGNSLGGLLSLRAAQRDDLPLLAVAPIAPAGLSHSRLLEGGFVWAKRLRPALGTVRVLPVPASFLRARLQHAYASRLGHGRADPSLAYFYASHYRGMGDVHRLIPVALSIGEELPLDPVRLEDIQIPVALLLGRRDPLISTASAAVLLAVLPDAQLTVFEDCGHCPQLERPDDIAALLAALPGDGPATPQ